ncbi:MAG TPA: hypothetical protein VH158_09695 [Gemmatimonadales bacterium]|jgi:hypothetical protein|nr:hypothetical protein [Gemmatimonadales bacterium]
MSLGACGIVAAWLVCGAYPVSAQGRSAADSELSRSIGRWEASGVSFQSGGAVRRFSVEVERVGDQLQATVPAELKLAGGQVYRLDRVGAGVFRYVDSAGRVVEFALTGENRASFVVVGRGGDGRVTWQLTRST